MSSSHNGLIGWEVLKYFGKYTIIAFSCKV